MNNDIQTKNSTSSNGLVEWIRTRQVATFFILTFLISWSLWGLVFLTGSMKSLIPSGLTGVFALLVGFGPFFSASIIIKVSGNSIRSWLRQIVTWRLKLRWYFVALGLPLLSFTIIGVIYSLYKDTSYLKGMEFEMLLFLIPLFFWNTLLGGGQEELGWRGFALPKLQNKYGALKSSLILGFFHSIWHLPMIFIANSYQANTSFILYTVSVTAGAVLYTWLYNSTGSVLIAMILHGAGNTFPTFAILPSFNFETMEIPKIPLILEVSDAAVALVLAIIIVIGFGAKRLTKKSETSTL